MKKLIICDHPLIQHKVSLLRDKNTGSKEFRELVNEVSMLIGYEATRDLPLKEVSVETPVAIARTNVISGRKLAIVPILRAGIGMVDGLLALVPAAKVGHIGISRDKRNDNSVSVYYNKLPSDVASRDVILLDLMLATGASAIKAIEAVKQQGVSSVKLITALSCPEGVRAVHDQHPDVDIYTGAMDEGLNDELYITPGIGDGGDRIFGTK
ncbi:MAG: uracil phosphoribosyltransferase [Clostridiales bacterium]|nr:uracil phosphoribosyltransferase [Clostridiales bacterium]